MLHGFNKLQRLIRGQPDLGWRQRYNAVGTEEWARFEPGEPTAEAIERPPALEPSRPPRTVDERMPDAPGLELIAQGIEEGREGTVIETSFEHGTRDADRQPRGVLHALAWLRDTPEQGYRFLSSLHAADYLPADPPLRRPLRAALPRAGRAHQRQGAARGPGRGRESTAPTAAEKLPELDSCVELYPTAEFQEREAYDFFGIVFRGHPDLRRIADARGLRRLAAAPRLPDRRRAGALHPQRDRSPAVVRVMADETAQRRSGHHRARRRPPHRGPLAPLVGAARSEIAERELEGPGLEPEQEVLTINMGPHHPATHGVLRLIVTLQGERVIELKPVMGYLHTGIEKSCEDKSYWKVIPFVERMDYLSYFFQMEAFCGCVERLVELEIPPRAKYLRVLHMELDRIMSHLVWLGTTALDLGAISMLWYCFRERDTILDLFEMSSGQRMHTRYFQVGGVFEDIPARLRAEGAGVLRGHAEPRSTSTRPCSTATRSSCSRTRDVGIVSRERLLELGVTGPLLRAAGEPWDLRKADRLPGLRRLRLQDPGRHRRRRLRPLPRPRCRRCASRCGSSSRRSTGCPRARGSPTTASTCCRLATSSPPRWRR